MKNRTKKALVNLFLGMATIAILASALIWFFIAPKFQEFMLTEDAKTEWLTVQQFKKGMDRYPIDLKELYDYCSYYPKEVAVTYLPPKSINKDEIILWMNQKSRTGTTVAVRESGQVVKMK